MVLVNVDDKDDAKQDDMDDLVMFQQMTPVNVENIHNEELIHSIPPEDDDLKPQVGLPVHGTHDGHVPTNTQACFDVVIPVAG